MHHRDLGVRGRVDLRPSVAAPDEFLGDTGFDRTRVALVLAALLVCECCCSLFEGRTTPEILHQQYPVDSVVPDAPSQ